MFLSNLQSNDDKEKSNSPFDSNGIKKEDQGNNRNGLIMNGEDDKGVFKWVEFLFISIKVCYRDGNS